MRALVELKDYEEGIVDHYPVEIKSKDRIVYKDQDGGFVRIDIFDGHVELLRRVKDHQTELFLGEKSYARIKSPEGELELPLKTIAFSKNDDIVFIVYEVETLRKEIRIKYSGD